MNQNKRKKSRCYQWCFITLIGSFLLVPTTMAQDAISASGGDASGSEGSASFSVGQVAYTSQSGTTGSVSEGVQQGFEISVSAELEEGKGIALFSTVYPNPTKGSVTLKVDELKTEAMVFHLVNADGSLLMQQEVSNNETVIDLSRFSDGIYLLKVSKGQKEVKVFKIIKH